MYLVVITLTLCTCVPWVQVSNIQCSTCSTRVCVHTCFFQKSYQVLSTGVQCRSMYVTFHTITLQCFINISCSTSNKSLLPRRSSVFKEDNWTIWSTLIVVKLLLDRSKCSRLGSSNTPSGNFVSPLLDRLREVKVVSFCWFWVNHSARRQTVEKKKNIELPHKKEINAQTKQ